MARERLIEFLIGLVFIVFLVLVVLLILNFGTSGKITSSNSGQSSSEPIVVNKYYEVPGDYSKKIVSGNVVYKNTDNDYVVYKKDYDSWHKEDYGYWNKDHHHDDEFSSSGKHKKVKQGISYFDEYTVSVRNEDNVGKYFKVVFYFEDSSDFEDSEIRTKWIGSGDVENFVYKDVHFERNNYEKWSYDVFGQDDGFEKELYESNSRATRFHSFPTDGCR